MKVFSLLKVRRWRKHWQLSTSTKPLLKRVKRIACHSQSRPQKFADELCM
nr:MAG TPA: hypothetical protein [Caudoviricetes sp.]